MREQRLVAVDRLQHQEVGELGRRAPAGRRDASGERFATLMEQPEQLGGEGRQPTRRPHMQHGRNEVVVEHDLLVGPAFDHVRERHAGVGLGDVARQQQPRAQRPHFEQRRVSAARRRIARLHLAHVMPHQFVGARLTVGFELARAAQRHGKIQDLIADVRCRCRSASAADRRRASETACRRGTRRPARRNAELADAQKIAFELDLGEAPAVRDERTGTASRRSARSSAPAAGSAGAAGTAPRTR